jgi:hypothetical protein
MKNLIVINFFSIKFPGMVSLDDFFEQKKEN